jgi:serine/threonine protein kinase
MKSSLLILGDGPNFCEWFGLHASTRWPYVLVETARLNSVETILEVFQPAKYRLIVVRLSFTPENAEHTYRLLTRLTGREDHPPVVVIADDGHELHAVQAMKLGVFDYIPADRLAKSQLDRLFDAVESLNEGQDSASNDGAPQIPGYTIRRPVAATYTSAVYWAFSEKLRKDVALKVLDISYAPVAGRREITMWREHNIMRRIASPHVARVFEYGETDELAYLAMEYLPRGSVLKVIEEAGQSVSRLEMLVGVAQGLREVHRAGYVHLDVKPDNVLIRQDSTPVLIDFGISRRVSEALEGNSKDIRMGSPYYMSPEQARGQPVDQRSDLYSFGALWYTVFTGRKPYRGNSVIEILEAHERMPGPSLGNALRHYQPIIDGTLATSPNDRFANADALIQAIEACSAAATGVHRLDMGVPWLPRIGPKIAPTATPPAEAENDDIVVELNQA